MADKVSIAEELRFRIQADIDAFGGNLPERYALAWGGYLAGLMEWKVIEFQVYSKLVDLLPPIADPNPIVTIFLGRE